MLGSLVAFSVRYRLVVVAISIVFLAYGLYRLTSIGTDIFPEFAPKYVQIQTEAPGFSAEQIELMVTQPLEASFSGLMGIYSISSQSIRGLSVITLVFDDSTDRHRNRQIVAERLFSAANLLPEDVGSPIILPLSSSSATVMTVALTSEHASMMALRSLVDWTLRPRLLAVPGVADVNIFGGEVQQLQVRILPDALRAQGLSMDHVLAAVQESYEIRGAGFIENNNQRIVLRPGGGPATPEDLGRLVVRHRDGLSLLLSDVADIAFAPAPRISAARVGEEPAVLMMIIGQYQANTDVVTTRLEEVLAEFDDRLAAEGIELHPALFRPADYIEASLRNISGHLLVGGAFVIGILFLFLFNMRTALISATAIPLSLVGAAVVLAAFGYNMNIMVMGGLAIALGEVVDDAIIDTENVFRRLRQNSQLSQPEPVYDVVFKASMEVRGSVVYASFIVILVFVPLLTLGGVAGHMFEPLGLAYILAILVSLLVALTLTPALCGLMLTRGELSSREPPVFRFLTPCYDAVLRSVGAGPRLAVAWALLLTGGSIAVLPVLETEFLPELREGHYMIHTASLPGTSLDESIRVGSEIIDRVAAIEGVRSVSQWAGRAELGADTFGVHYSEFEVDLEPLPGSEQQRVKDSIRAILESFPGLFTELNSFLIERIDETISGYTSPIVINVYGNDLDALDVAAGRVAAVVDSVDGVSDVRVPASPSVPLLHIDVKLEELTEYGLRPDDVYKTVQTAYKGRQVGQIYRGNRAIPVAVILEDTHRGDLGAIGRLPLATASGGLVPLDEVATIRQAPGRYAVLRREGQRVQAVVATLDDRPLGSVFADIKSRLRQDVVLPSDTHLEFTGAAVEQAEAQRQLIIHSLLVGVGILVLLYIALGSLRHTVLVLVNLPFALVGGVVAAVIDGGVLSLGSYVGFVTLFGITLRNSIMLVSHYRYLVEQEGAAWNFETSLRGARERLPSILITALVTALAMVPIAFDSDNPGREIMGPMAAIVIGGLVSSSILNLLLLPSIMLRYGRFSSVEGEDHGGVFKRPNSKRARSHGAS